jgi:hypothetical protein
MTAHVVFDATAGTLVDRNTKQPFTSRLFKSEFDFINRVDTFVVDAGIDLKDVRGQAVLAKQAKDLGPKANAHAWKMIATAKAGKDVAENVSKTLSLIDIHATNFQIALTAWNRDLDLAAAEGRSIVSQKASVGYDNSDRIEYTLDETRAIIAEKQEQLKQIMAIREKVASLETPMDSAEIAEQLKAIAKAEKPRGVLRKKRSGLSVPFDLPEELTTTNE